MRDTYRERLDRFTLRKEAEEGRGLRLGWARLVTFVLAFGLYVGWDVASGTLALGLGIASLFAVLAFVVMVIIHRGVRARRRWYGTLARLNREALARLERAWRELPPTPMAPAGTEHPYALDLDVCGEASLFRLMNTVTTPPGAATLRAWLLAPASPEEIMRRQEAVAELAPQLHFRQLLQAEGEGGTSPPATALEDFLAWAEEEPWLRSRPWLVLGAWLIPLATLVLVVLYLQGVLGWPWWVVGLAAGFLVGGANQLSIHGIMARVSAGDERFLRYAALLERLSRMEVEAPLLRELREQILSSPVGAARELERLARRVAWAEVRHGSMVHVPLQALLVWDIHVLGSLERWKARSGPHVRSWVEALGTLEALAALAALQGDHPDWCLPELVDEGEAGPRLEASELGHPLLPQDRCTRNDVEVGPPGTFLFVTGSNMSGKSTLLRAVGANAVLAHAGGPVCARQLRFSPLRVQTSMRTTDSLSEGISQYMAELKRIKQVVDEARGGAENDPSVLFLLDEPLQGTNEAERRVAVQTILGHLLEAGAIGAVATHDLQLDSTDRLERAARAVHLEGTVREEAEGPLLEFDYLLKPGRATSTNALALLRAVGLGG